MRQIRAHTAEIAPVKSKDASAFYRLSEAERVALTERAIAGKGAVAERWFKPIEAAVPKIWEARAALAANWLRDEAGVADMGCGAMTLERALEPGQQYFPVDLTQRDQRTVVVDFNSAPPPAIAGASAAACLGVLEYLHEPQAFLVGLAAGYGRAVVSYAVARDIAGRRAHGWVNDLTQDDIAAVFKASGWRIVECAEVARDHLLWRLAAAEPPTAGEGAAI
jgi:hypothetical protein